MKNEMVCERDKSTWDIFYVSSETRYASRFGTFFIYLAETKLFLLKTHLYDLEQVCE